MNWHRGPIAAFDTETTSPEPEQARLVSATFLSINPVTSSVHERSWLVNPGVPIPAEATAVHGITDQQVWKDGQEPRDALPEIVTALTAAWATGTPVIAYNAPYDLTLLDHELARHGLRSIAEHGGPGLVVDPLVCDRRLDRYRRGKRTLTAACEHYKVRLDGAHDASFDAIAAARLAWRLAEVFPAVMQERGLEQLQADQARWHAEWAKHLQDYLRSSGKEPDAVVDGTWPYRPARTAVPA